jgi:hypothetical protein
MEFRCKIQKQKVAKIFQRKIEHFFPFLRDEGLKMEVISKIEQFFEEKISPAGALAEELVCKPI